MSKYRSTFKRATEFDGDTVTVTFVQIKKKHLFAMSGLLHQTGDGNFVLQGTEAEMIELMSSTLGDCVKSVEGLTDADGQPVSKETIFDEAYFLSLISWMFTTLVAGSKLGDEDEKKSDAPSDETSSKVGPSETTLEGEQ